MANLHDAIVIGTEVRAEWLHCASLVNFVDNQGRNAAHVAVMHGRVLALHDVCKAGCTPVLRDAAGKTPLDYAQGFGRVTDLLRKILFAASALQPYTAITNF